jgi:lipoate-protein ligase A
MGRRTLQLVRDSFPDRPAYDTAVSRAVMHAVARNELPETVRLARPGAMVAFGRQDVTSPGYAEAIAAARSHGFEAVERLAGGRAAVFDRGTVALAWAAPDRDPLRATHARFREAAAVVAEALRGLGVDARVGEVAGEYCPGDYSVNACGRVKLAGIGQRVVKGGAHLGGVVVVTGAARLRDVLVPVYEALGLEWDPATVGSIEGELPGASVAAVEDALLGALEARHAVQEERLPPDVLAAAEELERIHLSPAPERRASGEY